MITNIWRNKIQHSFHRTFIDFKINSNYDGETFYYEYKFDPFHSMQTNNIANGYLRLDGGYIGRDVDFHHIDGIIYYNCFDEIVINKIENFEDEIYNQIFKNQLQDQFNDLIANKQRIRKNPEILRIYNKYLIKDNNYIYFILQDM